ncbi:MAG TPA: hypothetical protein VMZ53_13915 [Kofleriaceae bacterium]|nr:hypothetical protein [Kofleriaceae bacterium]
MRSAVCLAGILAICALAHAQGSPDAGVPSPDAGLAAPSVAVDAGVAPMIDAPPAPMAIDAAAAGPVDAAGQADAAADVSLALPPPSRSQDAAWLLVGGTLTFITTGIVLAYAAESTETDIEDLYVSLNGQSPTFDAKTQERYDELVKQGNRYQYLSWISFGIAGGMAIGATVLFWKHHKEPAVVPVVTPNSAGVSVRF